MGRIISVIGISEYRNDKIVALKTALALSNKHSRKTVLALVGLGAQSYLEMLSADRDRNIKLTLSAIEPVSAPVNDTLLSLRSRNDFVITAAVDTAPSRIAEISSVSDLILHIMKPDLLSIKSAEYILNCLKSANIPNEFSRIIIDLSDKTPGIPKETIHNHLSIAAACEINLDTKEIMDSINSGNLWREWKNCEPICDTILKNEYAVSQPKKDAGAYGTPEFSVTDLKNFMHKKLVDEFESSQDDHSIKDNREKAAASIREYLSGVREADIPREDREKLVKEFLNDVFGYGCLENLLHDPGISEIMVNGHGNIFVEKRGKIERSQERFDSETRLRTVLDRIISPIGRRIDESSPIVDARLPDGSRVNAVIPPVSLCGPVVTIRKFSERKLSVEDLVSLGTLTAEMSEFIKICVLLRKNIVVSGGTGTGKTTLLNVVSSLIPPDERIVTIEDSAELRLPQEHVIRLESRPPSMEGSGEISIRRLVINALRMRPDRIIVGECRGGEALDMLQAMNTGHDGSLTTVHANSPKDAVSRIATMAMMSGIELPERTVKEQIVSAVNIIIQLSRMSDGSRKIIQISEICGMKDGAPDLRPIFIFNRTGIEESVVKGEFSPCGTLPTFYDSISTNGLLLEKKVFGIC